MLPLAVARTSIDAVPGARTRARMSRPVAFWSAGALLGSFLVAAAAPSPMYSVYQQQWGFSAVTLTAIFGVYAVALLLSLLFFGGLSDHLGRRPMLFAALAVEIAAMVAFLLAEGVDWLFAARVLQGVATGVAQATLGAILLDLEPRDRPGLGALVNSNAATLGLGAGALGSALLVQYAPAPTRTVYGVLVLLFVLGTVAALGIPETVARSRPPGGFLRPQVGIPPQVRGAFLAAAPCIVALWALGGLYFSLGPSLARDLAGSSGHVIGGVLLFLLSVSGTATTLVLRRVESRRLMVGGCLALVAGVAVTVAGVAAGSVALLLLGTTVAGGGFGVAFLGSYRLLVTLAHPGERGRLIAAVFVLSYLSFSLPTLAAGEAVGRIGLRTTALWYGSAVIGLALLSVAATTLATRRQSNPQ
jgi:MFS family permease